MHLLRHRKIPREHDAYLEEMKMKFAKRMDRFGEGIFSDWLRSRIKGSVKEKK